MHVYGIPLWKCSPFIRLLIPLIFGVLLQWYFQIGLVYIIVAISSQTIALFSFYLLPLSLRFKLQAFQGLLMLMLIGYIGMLITWKHDIRNDQLWFGNFVSDSSAYIINIVKPPSEKEKSYKIQGEVENIISSHHAKRAVGNIYLYFSKKDPAPNLTYGSRIIVKAKLQRIRNTGNPGAFDYEQYAGFQQVFHTAFVRNNDWKVLNRNRTSAVMEVIFFLHTKIINVIRRFVNGGKDVQGIAEALLIGYKDDLDGDMIRQYSNAGVVHIIAISGLHLGLIYTMLVYVCTRLPVLRSNRILRVVIILTSLWLFSILTGASASVLRSAVMFTCIIIGKTFFKQGSIYNSLAASAFILLCYNPFFLWDVGFQLSYLAVIGIVAIQRPIVELHFFKAAWIRKIWEMFAITLAAQLITFPICLYYFHQFPNLFFITNLFAVPLSTFILLTEICLLAFSWLPVLAMILGKVISGLIWLMNLIIVSCNKFPFSLTDNIYATPCSTLILYGFIISLSYSFINKSIAYFRFAIGCLFAFAAIMLFIRFESSGQKKIVLYNITGHQAIDFISDNQYRFYGDFTEDGSNAMYHFHLKPSRQSLQATNKGKALPYNLSNSRVFKFADRRMVIIDSALDFHLVKKLHADILLISHNSSVRIADVVSAVSADIIIFDASNSLWKIAELKKQCSALALPCYSIPEKGAYVLNIE